MYFKIAITLQALPLFPFSVFGLFDNRYAGLGKIQHDEKHWGRNETCITKKGIPDHLLPSAAIAKAIKQKKAKQKRSQQTQTATQSCIRQNKQHLKGQNKNCKWTAKKLFRVPHLFTADFLSLPATVSTSVPSNIPLNDLKLSWGFPNLNSEWYKTLYWGYHDWLLQIDLWVFSEAL